jgi:hypothetical protein
VRFSQHFGLSKTQPELDFVDIDPDRDMPLFLDPYALSVRTDPWSQECADDLRSFFQAAVDACAEPSELAGGAQRNHNTLMQSRAVATGLLQELSDAELVIPGMGPDKISDITTNVIRGRLIEYTQNECHLHQIALRFEPGPHQQGRDDNQDTGNGLVRSTSEPTAADRTRLAGEVRATVDDAVKRRNDAEE